MKNSRWVSSTYINFGNYDLEVKRESATPYGPLTSFHSDSISVSKAWEIDYQEIKVQYPEVGKGAFGIVYKGTLSYYFSEFCRFLEEPSRSSQENYRRIHSGAASGIYEGSRFDGIDQTSW